MILCFIKLCPYPAAILLAQTHIHRNISTDHGLPQSQVTALMRDTKGYLWIGMLGGLARWDGNEFYSIRLEDGSSPGGIRSLHEHVNGRIFAATNGQGLLEIIGQRAILHDKRSGLPDMSVRTIASDTDGALWVGTDKGLVRFTDAILDSASARIFFTGIVISDVKAYKNKVYAGCFDNGLYEFLNDTFEVLFPSLSSDIPKIRSFIYVEAENEWYVAVDGRGTAKITNNSLTWLAPLSDYRVQTMRWIKDGGVFFTTIGNGVYNLRNGKWLHIGEDQGLANNSVWAIETLENGWIALGTWGGLDFYDGGRIRSYRRENGLQDPVVLAIEEDPRQAIYFGTATGGVSMLYKNKWQHWNKKNGFPDLTIWSLLSTSRENFFVGTNNFGIIDITPSGSKKLYGKTEGLSENRVYVMRERSDGSVFIGHREGLDVLDKGKIYSYPKGHRWNRAFITGIHAVSDDEIYLATRYGVMHVNKGIVDTINRKKGLSDDHVWNVYVDSAQYIWASTNNGGITIFSNSTIDTINTRNGMSDNTVYGVIQYKENIYYAATHKGINRIEIKNGHFEINVITKSEGLPSDELNQGAFRKNSDGTMWFGTTKGAVHYDPRMEVRQPTPPNVHITRVRAFDNELLAKSASDVISLPYNENYIKFDFVGLNLHAPERVVYQYRLSSIDREWVTSEHHFCQYPNLSDGTYTFEVRASNEYGLWSEICSYRIIIEPPYWKTWWFIMLVTLAGGGLISLIVYSRIQAMLAVERLRNKIAADFHDAIGAGLTQVHYLTQTALMHSEKTEQVRHNLTIIDAISKSLYEEMRDIIWLVNPRRDSLYELILRLKESSEDMAEQSGVEFITENIDSLSGLRLAMERRSHIYLIFKEATANALKYSRCKTLTLTAHVKGDRLSIVLSDDGVGFEDAHPRAGGNGMHNMKTRALEANGQIEIHSEPNKGTRVTFTGKI